MYDAIFFTDETDNITGMPPIGAYKCAHVLRNEGYRCLVVNHFSSFNATELQALADIAINEQTKLIGFSTTFFKNIEVEKVEGQPTPRYTELPANRFFPHGKTVEDNVIDYFKQKNNKVKILVGGAKAHPNFNNKKVNYVCIGYSEKSIVNLMNHLAYGEELQHSSKNLWGCVVLDDRLAKEYDFVNSDFEWLPEDAVNHKSLPLEVARGCIFQCKFCSYPMNGKQNLDFVKSEKQLGYELQKNYEEYGITNYLLVDDTFNDHEAKLKRLHGVIKKLPFQPKFWGYHRLDLLATRPQTIDLLHDIGVRAMFFGMETMNPVSAKILGKGYNINKQIETLGNIRQKYGNDISLHGSFMVGVPEDTEDQNLKTLENILKQNIPLHSWIFHPFRIYRKDLISYSSDIIKNYESYGYSEDVESNSNVSPHVQYSMTFDKIINWKNKNTTYERVIKLSNFIMNESFQSDKLHITGQFAISIASMNHPNYTFDSVRNTLFKDFDFHDIEENVRKQFIEQYKQNLFSIINKNIITAD
jgi:hypothetical protein